MHLIDNDNNVKCYCWADEIEQTALQQIINMTSLADQINSIAIMPDVHSGKGCVIGSVIASDKIIIPSAIGSDIGCGVAGMKTDFDGSKITTHQLNDILELIEQRVPLGFAGNHSFNQIDQAFVKVFDDAMHSCAQKHGNHQALIDLLDSREWKSKYASLGGGNHFIELSVDNDNRLWIVCHSGSRMLGNIVGEYFTELAKRECENKNLIDPDLSYFEVGSDNLTSYIDIVNVVTMFAYCNRKQIINRVADICRQVLGPDYRYIDYIDCDHNVVSNVACDCEKPMYVHRKGATVAKSGSRAIIPGNMSTPSYIVEGLGNPLAWSSCSHGAGRKMSRRVAKTSYSFDDLATSMHGIVNNCKSNTVDEISYVYKNIDHVINLQTDLIKPINKLTQLLNVKG